MAGFFGLVLPDEKQGLDRRGSNGLRDSFVAWRIGFATMRLPLKIGIRIVKWLMTKRHFDRPLFTDSLGIDPEQEETSGQNLPPPVNGSFFQ